MNNIKYADLYMYENGNTGYYKINITVAFNDGVTPTFSEIFNTGLESEVVDLLFCDLDDLLNGELTQQGYQKWENLKSKSWWTDAMLWHDKIVALEVESKLESIKQKIEEFESKLNMS